MARRSLLASKIIKSSTEAESYGITNDTRSVAMSKRQHSRTDTALCRDIVIYCLDTVKIRDANVHVKALKSASDSDPILLKKIGRWIMSLKAITNSCEASNY